MDGQLQRDAGFPHGYYEILVRLSEAPDRALRMSQLAEASTSSKSRLSHAVARLEERGWVERLSCPTDRRGLIAGLTDQGFAALRRPPPPMWSRSGEPFSTSSVPGRSRSSARSAKRSSAAEPTCRAAAADLDCDGTDPLEQDVPGGKAPSAAS